MPLNFYSFLIANMLAEREFEDKKVPNKDRSQQLGLVASVFSPSGSGGGLGSSVLPAVLVQQTARREAEDAAKAAANKSSLDTASGSTGSTPGQNPGQTPGQTPGTGAVTRDEFQALSARVDALEARLTDYPNVKGKTFADARVLLKEFHILMVDEILGNPIDDTKQVVFAQIPEARDGMKLLRGSVVAIAEAEPRLGDNG